VTADVISGNTRANLRTAWFFAAVWNLVSAPMLVIIPRELARNPLAAFGFLFPVIGVGLLTWAVMTTLRWRRFGASRFEMGTVPATPGGQLSGTIYTRFASDQVHSIRLTLKLTCLNRITRRGSDHSETRETILWREEYTIPEGQIGVGATGASIPGRFALPADARETTATKGSDGIVWVLSAEADMPGVDFKEDFDVPVRRIGESSGQPLPPRSSAIALPRQPVSIAGLAESGIHIRPTAEGTEYHFGAGRNASFALGLAVFTLIWTGALYLQYMLDFPRFFLAITGLFELLLLLILADIWLGSTRVIIGAGAVRRRHTILGLGSTRVIPSKSIRKLDLHISMQSSGRSGTPYYELRATLETGKHKHLGSGIRDKRHAEWLIERMRQEIGLEVPSDLRVLRG
jgi:hypothetical protein